MRYGEGRKDDGTSQKTLCNYLLADVAAPIPHFTSCIELCAFSHVIVIGKKFIAK